MFSPEKTCIMDAIRTWTAYRTTSSCRLVRCSTYECRFCSSLTLVSITLVHHSQEEYEVVQKELGALVSNFHEAGALLEGQAKDASVEFYIWHFVDVSCMLFNLFNTPPTALAQDPDSAVASGTKSILNYKLQNKPCRLASNQEERHSVECVWFF